MTEEIGSCCGDVYNNEAARMILGEGWHPGGLELTGKLVHRLGVGSGHVVLDVACGIGTSASFLPNSFGCRVIGLDRSQASTAEAARHVTSGTGMTQFAVSDSHHLPLMDGSVDAVVLECVLSTFAYKDAAVRELARVLKPGGKMGITDVVVDGELPPALKASWLQPFCVSGALSMAKYQELLDHSGFETIIHEYRTQDAIEFIENVRKRLFVVQMLSGVGKLPVSREDVEQARRLIMTVKRSVEEHKLGYALFVAQKRG